MTEHGVRIADQDIAFTTSAGSGRPVVFVHGNSSSARVWRPLLTGAFGERFRCLALDLPGHGRSAPTARSNVYSMPGYAEILTGFIDEVSAQEAVIVGWSLGGHIAIEAAPSLPGAAGFVVFGTPPVASAEHLAQAFLPNPAVNIGFTAQVDPEAALSYARSFLAPGSPLQLDELVADILATDGAARAGLAAGIGTGRFSDEVAIVTRLTQPIAVLHGADEQLVNLDYLRGLTMPTLWRDAVQVIPGAGHAPHLETPQQFADILTEFISDLD
ncbi:alpha/beta fold hydrolase [Sinosporangium siamense]|uniref:alpha/beta fold hydrolase n=1 Tax=Sinosporangium siamense TaxID=1367973 RepID=UPI0019512791|nr:alpha/beta hydrolase [Sinosporangium siamense]